MSHPLSDLIDATRTASSMEEASRALLSALLTRTDEALQRSAFRRGGRVLRAMLHLRPSGGYQGLVIVDRTDGDVEEALVPSATAGRYVMQSGGAVAVDVHEGQLQYLRPDAPLRTVDLWAPPEDADPDTPAPSQHRLLSRSATHLFLLPLVRARDVVGFVSIELSCMAGVGQELFWWELLDDALVRVAVATPWILSLPSEQAAPPAADPLLPVVGRALQGLVRLLAVFATQDETILISGPTGAGKSRLARWVHAHSGRPGELVAVELQAIPEELQAPTLFGWRKGAFTGAVRDQAGLVADAGAGTLFIDEIDKLSLSAQATLLQLLEDRTFRSMGDTRVHKARCRILVGTNADLMALVEAGRFREDLYYRIHVLPVRLPGLDERRDEIVPWAGHMLRRRHEEAGGRGVPELSSDAGLSLRARSWPGNLRQLDNVIRRAYAVALADVLARGSDPSEAFEVSGVHVDRALSFESRRGEQGPLASLEAAARAFVAHAQAAAEGGETLPIELLEGIQGMALAAAAELTGSREEAFRLFGKDRMVEGRNHHKIWRREIERARALYEGLGGTPPADLDP